MLRLFTKVFGTKSERDLKALWPYVAQINTAFERLRDVSNDTLREETSKLKAHIKRQLQPIVDEQRATEKKAEEDT